MVLPDILANGLKVVFCGTAPGNISAKAGAYYANNSNKFWEMLYKMGLTKKKMDAKELPEKSPGTLPTHENIRGKDYYK